MKVLIWLACVFLFECVHVLLNKSGFHFGFIGEFLFYGILIYTASTLSKKFGEKWEMDRFYRKAAQAGMSAVEYAKKDIPKSFLLEIEAKYRHPEELNGYLTMCVKEKVVTRVQANVILNHSENQKRELL